MKAKDLVKELIKLNPEAEILIEVSGKYSTVIKPVERIEPEGCNEFRQVLKP